VVSEEVGLDLETTNGDISLVVAKSVVLSKGRITTIIDGAGLLINLMKAVCLRSSSVEDTSLLRIKRNCKSVWLSLLGGVAGIKVGAGT